MAKKRKIIGYIRVSTSTQNTQKNESQILRFANEHDFGKVEFVYETISGARSWKTRKLNDVVSTFKKGDIMIVSELSRIGRSLHDVISILQVLGNAGVKVYSVKENFQLNGDDIQSKIMRTLLGLFAEIERDLLQMRTREGLAAARLKGRIGGRPKGSGSSVLDPHHDAILVQLHAGVKKKFIAKSYGLTPGALTAWLKKNKIP